MGDLQNQPLHSDEIDISELLAKGLQGLKNNYKSFLKAITGGIVLGYLIFLFAPKRFESKMLISSDILTESYSKTIIEDLEQLIDEKNYIQLTNRLNLTEDQAAALRKIEINAVLEKADVEENQKTYLTITCRSKDNTIWPALQKGLVSFFEENDFVKIRVDHRKKYNTQIIEKIDKELNDLNDLKLRIMEGKITQATKDNLVLFDPTTINSKILDLNKEKIHLQNGLEVINSIQVVESFTPFEKPVAPKFSISIISGAALGFIVVIMTLFLNALNGMIKSKEKIA